MTTSRMPQILSYADRLSVAPGEPIEFKISSHVDGELQADVVRLVHGDRNPEGPGFKEVEVETTVSGLYPARHQDIDAGSLVLVEDSGRLDLAQDFTLHAYIAPTLPSQARQTIIARYDMAVEIGVALELGPDGVALRLGDGDSSSWRIATGKTLYPSTWYSVYATFKHESQTVTVSATPLVTATNSRIGAVTRAPGGASATGRSEVLPARSSGAATIAAAANGARFDAHFNGKIESPGVWSRVLGVDELSALDSGSDLFPREGLMARWDFAAAIGPRGVVSDAVEDRGPFGLTGQCVNGPALAMTGHRWNGIDERFVHVPEQYAAIHFHDDDLEDCGWQTDIAWTVPATFPTGAYALRLAHDGHTDRQPFFVLPPRGTATADVLLLIPTASYLAYSNERISPTAPLAQSIFGQTPVLGLEDLYLHEHPELGLSLYDGHSDGSGVHLSSSRRPIMNLRPDKRTSLGGPWQFPADLHLVDWLESRGIAYDVATDLELHQEGAELLSRYRVVLTGSHPEYVSRESLDAWDTYLGAGGRALYLGANGFYWVTNWHPQKPYQIEVRRGESGVRAWQAQPGELHLQTNGERGGLWRWRGRAPQKLVGTGFATQGFDRSTHYAQTKDVEDPEVTFIFEGVGRDEQIGAFGLEGGGAAGFEVDRYDLTLGTPPGTRLLAHSEGLSDNYPRVAEEIQFAVPHMGATMDYQARADVVYFGTQGGGGVFSVSSIAWCGSLSHDGYDNNVSRITENVIRRFLDPEPLPV